MRTLALIAVTVIAACGAGDRVASPPTTSPAIASPADEWRCGGELVPPTGWEQETAFAPASAPNAREEAARRATDALARRLCAGSPDCAPLAARVRPWKTGANEKDVCAMAVVKREDLDEWRARSQSTAAVDGAMLAAADDLAKATDAPRAKRPRVAIAEVVDLGVPGGARAEWLRAKLARALERTSDVVDVPRGWSGAGVPPGLDLVVRGDVVARAERGVAVLEVTWDGVTASAKHVHAAPVVVAEAAAPRAGGAAVKPLPPAEGLSVHIESSRAGSLCAGERTQLWVESAQPAAVRVFDLYGDGEAMLMFPNDEQKSGELRAGQPVALGGKLGFEALPVPGSDQERFLVVAAPNEAGLGALRAALGPCRVPAALARQLHQGAGLPPGTRAASTGFRVVTESCPPAPAERRAGVVQSLAALPPCKL